jgi:hypothetical protein
MFVLVSDGSPLYFSKNGEETPNKPQFSAFLRIRTLLL